LKIVTSQVPVIASACEGIASHIGEYDTKTNAFCDCREGRRASETGRLRTLRVLLSVVLQHLIAGLGYLGAILLQASQNGEIALIDHRTAVALNVTRTGCLLLRRAAAWLVGDGGGGKG
jgi:hypothetical protein